MTTPPWALDATNLTASGGTGSGASVALMSDGSGHSSAQFIRLYSRTIEAGADGSYVRFHKQALFFGDQYFSEYMHVRWRYVAGETNVFGGGTTPQASLDVVGRPTASDPFEYRDGKSISSSPWITTTFDLNSSLLGRVNVDVQLINGQCTNGVQSIVDIDYIWFTSTPIPSVTTNWDRSFFTLDGYEQDITPLTALEAISDPRPANSFTYTYNGGTYTSSQSALVPLPTPLLIGHNIGGVTVHFGYEIGDLSNAPPDGITIKRRPSWTPLVGTVGEPVHFADTTDYTGIAGATYRWVFDYNAWDFGTYDATTQNPSWTFNTAGTYTVYMNFVQTLPWNLQSPGNTFTLVVQAFQQIVISPRGADFRWNQLTVSTDRLMYQMPPSTYSRDGATASGGLLGGATVGHLLVASTYVPKQIANGLRTLVHARVTNANAIDVGLALRAQIVTATSTFDSVPYALRPGNTAGSGTPPTIVDYTYIPNGTTAGLADPLPFSVGYIAYQPGDLVVAFFSNSNGTAGVREGGVPDIEIDYSNTQWFKLADAGTLGYAGIEAWWTRTQTTNSGRLGMLPNSTNPFGMEIYVIRNAGNPVAYTSLTGSYSVQTTVSEYGSVVLCQIADHFAGAPDGVWTPSGQTSRHSDLIGGTYSLAWFQQYLARNADWTLQPSGVRNYGQGGSVAPAILVPPASTAAASGAPIISVVAPPAVPVLTAAAQQVDVILEWAMPTLSTAVGFWVDLYLDGEMSVIDSTRVSASVTVQSLMNAPTTLMSTPSTQGTWRVL